MNASFFANPFLQRELLPYVTARVMKGKNIADLLEMTVCVAIDACRRGAWMDLRISTFDVYFGTSISFRWIDNPPEQISRLQPRSFGKNTWFGRSESLIMFRPSDLRIPPIKGGYS